MTNEFQKPFAPPPAIFGVTLLVGLGIDLIFPLPVMPLVFQLGSGMIAVTTGVLVICSSMKSIHRAGTTYNPYSASTALVTSGIYQYTRNPGYLGLAVIQFGLALIIDSLWIAISTVVAVFVIDQFVIKLEEEKLGRTFGQQYQDYLAQVRRWI
ncbi:MAG: isoprenylcysteine carboxylmethyltransferase family protein [Gammaproteobacteria bacterium]|nr:isoprenylcysteine carboxylmethyltransferase family protein [Gammaproteobacteria bacterium]